MKSTIIYYQIINEAVIRELTAFDTTQIHTTKDVLSNVVVREDGWKAFRIQGILDFSLIGILPTISIILVERKIGILAVSNYKRIMF